MSYRFLKRESLQKGVKRIVSEQIKEVLEAVNSSRPDIEAVHSARKALKRLRSLLRLIRTQIGEETFARESICCRDTGRLLSSARDADVRLATFNALAGAFGSHLESAALIRKALEADVRTARHGGLNSKKRKAVAHTLEMARARIGFLVIGEGWKVLEPGLRRSFRRAHKSFKATFASEPDVEALHTCRKRFKDLLYQLGLVRSALGPAFKEIEGMTKKMGELLGDERDLGLLCENLTNRSLDGVTPEAVGFACEKIALRQAQIQKRAAKLGHEILEAMSDAFPKKMRKCWKKWRSKTVPSPAR